MTTSSFATAVTNGVTRTTATQVKSTCATVTGCGLRDVEETTTVEACKLTRRDIGVTNLAEATGVPGVRTLQERAAPDWSCESPGNDWVIILNDRTGTTQQRDDIEDALDQRDQALDDLGKPHGYHEVRSERLGYTAYFFVEHVGHVTAALLKGYYDDVGGKNHLETNCTSSADDDYRGGLQPRMKSDPALLSIKSLWMIRIVFTRLLYRSAMSEMATKTRPSYPGVRPGSCTNDLLTTGVQNYGISRCCLGIQNSLFLANILSPMILCTTPETTCGHRNGIVLSLASARQSMSWKLDGCLAR